MQQVMARIRAFRDERDWMQFHDPKNLAVSIAIEAAELLEHFQWKDKAESERHAAENRNAVAEEIADVAIYLLELADNLGIDLKGFWIDFDGVSSSEKPVLVEVCTATFATNAPGTNSTTVTVQRQYGKLANTGFAAARNWTSEPTTLVVIDAFALDPHILWSAVVLWIIIFSVNSRCWT